MPIRRNEEATLAPKLALRCGISLAGAVLIASVFGVPSASITSPGKAAGAVGSVVPPVAGISAPSLPSAAPTQTPIPTEPQAPVEVPTVPQAPVETSAAPQASPVEVPGTTQKSLHLAPVPSGDLTKPASPGVDLPSVNEIANGTKESAGPASAASTAGAQQTAASARNGVGKGSGSHRAAHPGVEPGSVESAKVAPLPRLLAYVWPAIALGPAWNLLATLQARWEAVTSLAISDVPRLLSGLTGATGAGGVAGISEHSATPNPSPADSPGTDVWVPDGSAISHFVFIVLCAALIALLVFTVRRELRSMDR
jgi:hypothetical protein